ncbi:hypothetical protein [Ulvibacterium marinum]|uniref:Alpha glucuronidase N-terminal domain-containing protein n=1 Tax=Ulvibacterium marinum TaxID=2419782 RepID=A0A3B0C710_9FLAO|nr:hypothetical protein [Ulvibacterium marinum]RKN80760.1 hypothetical protein D7Z94_07265 [Ulvibacterium marinum]
MRAIRVPFIVIWFLLSGGLYLKAQTNDFSKSEIACLSCKGKLAQRAVLVLQEEIALKSNISLPIAKKWSTNSRPKILVGIEGELKKLPKSLLEPLTKMDAIGPEGYKLLNLPKLRTVLVIGHDERGTLYGVGKLLRKAILSPGSVLIPEQLKLASTPKNPIRGHQLGYRPKTNAYDAFSVAQFDRYIRDLVIFGANSIEIVPPRTDDDFSSVHMEMPAIEMIAEQSRICDSYGVDVWMWYPNMGMDYTHSDSLQVEIDERHRVFKQVKRLDALFVPGGDPGDLTPDNLFRWLDKVASVLHKYHPKAKVWVSPQVFRPTKKWYDAFYAHINQGYDWFGGIVFGPWIKTPIQEIRERIHPDIPIRRYPDITHSLSSQYPVPKWDLAYAITLGRECINPRPYDQKFIHNALDEYAQGSISYSEGTNDDVNKIVWSDQDWNPETPVIETLRDYARYFIGPDYTEGVAQGLLALENNLDGPLLGNHLVLRTLHQWQALEKKAPKEVLANFRFQMGLLRAYFDAYQYRRLLYETELEQRARDILTSAKTLGSQTAIGTALKTLARAVETPIMPQWKARCLQLADNLFTSIGAQLTIEQHGAMPGRGNFIDTIDEPLNDVLWFADQLMAIKNLPNESERRKAIQTMLQRTDPGPGGFYDNLGSPQSWKRVTKGKDRRYDPGNLASPRVAFGVGLSGEEWVHEVSAKGFDGRYTPLAWTNQISTLYDNPLEMTYEDLDSNESYSVRVAYTGRFPSRVKMTIDNVLVHDFIKTGMQPIYEFKIPETCLEDGKIHITWTCGEGERGTQVSEIWILKNDIPKTTYFEKE